MSSISPNPDLSFGLRSDHLAAYLRADRVRHDTIMHLLMAWHDGGRENLIELFDSLDDAARPAAPSEVQDAASQTVEDHVGMMPAIVPLDRANLARLVREAAHVTGVLNRSVTVPAPTDGTDR